MLVGEGTLRKGLLLHIMHFLGVGIDVMFLMHVKYHLLYITEGEKHL
jgi:hypothetical protein